MHTLTTCASVTEVVRPGSTRWPGRVDEVARAGRVRTGAAARSAAQIRSGQVREMARLTQFEATTIPTFS